MTSYNSELVTSTFLHTLTAKSLRQEGEENTAVCPVSVLLGTVAVALAATKDSDTHKETCTALGIDGDNETAFLEECQNMCEDLLEKQEVRVQLSIATSMWCENVKPEYKLVCQNKLQAQVGGLSGCKAINAWVEENTNGMIKEVMTSDPEGPLVVVPVMAFNGRWTFMFEDDEATSKFHVSPAEEMQCAAMRLHAKLSYAKINGVQIVELPYGTKQGFKAYVLLPHVLPGALVFSAASAIDLIADGDNWKGVQESLTETLVSIYMPMFTVETNVSMKEILSDLGMPSAFGKDSSFGRMSEDPDVYVESMQHLVKIEVNSVGTKAAAATPVVFKPRGSGGSSKATTVDVNRPFVFLITRGDVILFASLVRKPKK
jgi:serine protease inhibitor